MVLIWLAIGIFIGLICHKLAPKRIRPQRVADWAQESWLRIRRTPMRRNLPIISLPVAFIVLALSLVTAVSSIIIINDASQYPVLGNGLNSMSSLVMFGLGGLLVGALFIALLYLRLLSNDMHEALAETWSVSRGGVRFLVSVAFVIIGLPILLYVVATNATEESSQIVVFVAKIVSYLDRYAGGPIGFIGATIALVAFYLTIQQLRDFQTRITNFAQLLERVVKLGASADPGNPMHIITYTPAIGYLAENHIGWGKVADAIIGIEENSGKPACKTKIITQPEASLADWHGKFVGRKTKRRERVSAELASAATEEARRIKKAIISCDPASYIEISFSLLPGYYCFFTNRRALIVAPLFLPLSVRRETVEDAMLMALPSPHMIGFETTDRGIIDQLIQQFDYIEAHLPVGGAAPETPPASKIAA